MVVNVYGGGGTELGQGTVRSEIKGRHHLMFAT